MDLRAFLAAEHTRRRTRNPRYSLRSFARSLGVSHATLVRLLHQRKRLTPRTARLLGGRLGFTDHEIARATAHENSELLLGMVTHPGFRADCRWLAVMTGLPLDDVNVALHSLLHSRRLSMDSANLWHQETT